MTRRLKNFYLAINEPKKKLIWVVIQSNPVKGDKFILQFLEIVPITVECPLSFQNGPKKVERLRKISFIFPILSRVDFVVSCHFHCQSDLEEILYRGVGLIRTAFREKHLIHLF